MKKVSYLLLIYLSCHLNVTICVDFKLSSIKDRIMSWINYKKPVSSDKYKNLDPNIAKFLLNLEKQNNRPIYKLPIEDARKVLSDLQKNSYNTIPARIQDLNIPYEKNKVVSIRIVRPEKLTGILPVIIYFHGGGWILGDKFTHDRLIRELANKINAAIVFLNYTPSPEAQYSTIIEEAYGTLKYISEHGTDLELDTNHLAIVGDSVGGNMAAVVTLLAKERKGPKIDYQVLFYPVTKADFNTKSYQEFSDGFWLTREAMKWFWNAYAPDVNERDKYIISPLNATIEQLKNLPSTLIINGENDVLRDEGEAYARKLIQAGVDVIQVRYLGTIHDFVLLDPLKDTVATKSAIDLASNKLKEILHK